jgi:hypothetical protein
MEHLGRDYRRLVEQPSLFGAMSTKGNNRCISSLEESVAYLQVAPTSDTLKTGDKREESQLHEAQPPFDDEQM